MDRKKTDLNPLSDLGECDFTDDLIDFFGETNTISIEKKGVECKTKPVKINFNKHGKRPKL